MVKNYSLKETGKGYMTGKIYYPRYTLVYHINNEDTVEKYFGRFQPTEIEIDQFAQTIIEHYHKKFIEVELQYSYVEEAHGFFYGNEYTGGTWIQNWEGHWTPASGL